MSVKWTERGIAVRLSISEVIFAANVAVLRVAQNIKEQHQPKDPTPKESAWQYMILGTIGELVVTKWLGWYWNNTVGDRSVGDVGPYEVRATPVADGHLILREHDPIRKDNKPYILVTGDKLDYLICGWIFGGDGKKLVGLTDKKNTGRPAYWVEQKMLQSIDTLPKPEEIR